jgi:hypothetical protein
LSTITQPKAAKTYIPPEVAANKYLAQIDPTSEAIRANVGTGIQGYQNFAASPEAAPAAQLQHSYLGELNQIGDLDPEDKQAYNSFANDAANARGLRQAWNTNANAPSQYAAAIRAGYGDVLKNMQTQNALSYLDKRIDPASLQQARNNAAISWLNSGQTPLAQGEQKYTDVSNQAIAAANATDPNYQQGSSGSTGNGVYVQSNSSQNPGSNFANQSGSYLNSLNRNALNTYNNTPDTGAQVAGAASSALNSLNNKGTYSYLANLWGNNQTPSTATG